MKALILLSSIVITGSLAFSQSTTQPNTNSKIGVDSLDKKLKIKQLEVMEKELDLKVKEYEIKNKELEIQQERFEIDKLAKIEEEKRYQEKEKEYQAEQKRLAENRKKEEDESKRYRDYNTLIFFEPLPLFIGTFQGGIEKKIMPKKTLRFSLGLNNTEDAVFYEFSNTKGVKVELQYRMYLEHDEVGNEGFYVGGYGFMKTMTRDYNSQTSNGGFNQVTKYTTTGKVASMGFLCGYNLFIIDRLTLDMYVGTGINYKLGTFNKSDLSLPFINSFGNGTTLRFGFSIGVPIKNNNK